MEDLDHNEVTKIKTKKSRNNDHMLSTKQPENLNDSTIRGGTEQPEEMMPKKIQLRSLTILKDQMKESPNLNFSQQKGDGDSEIEEGEPEVDVSRHDEFFAHGKYHTFSPKSVWMLGNGNPVRAGIVWIITHKRFDQVIVCLILVNSLLLGIKDYTDVKNESSINQFVEQCEPLFAWAFSIECVLKILGMGFILDPGSYLRDVWNWLDFIVVVSSLLTAIPQM